MHAKEMKAIMNQALLPPRRPMYDRQHSVGHMSTRTMDFEP